MFHKGEGITRKLSGFGLFIIDLDIHSQVCQRKPGITIIFFFKF